MKSQFGWMGERENGVMKLEGRLGPDPIGFISQGKEFGFHSNCDGSLDGCDREGNNWT